ncbi:MAG: antibiotic biosynthesis monooxygenase family protein [Pikeienuella sp.]
MIAIIFEVEPAHGKQDAYLDHAATLKPMLEEMDGFVSVERFESLSNPGKLLSISFWRDEAAVAAWRNHEVHREMQRLGRSGLFAGYRLRVAGVLRDYGLTDRGQAPQDSAALF